MNAAEALRSIRYDWLSYIQERVRVDFDNARQAPVHFTHRGQGRSVQEVLGRFRIRDELAFHGFLVEADDEEVYFLYFHKMDSNRRTKEGYWVLGFRILSDRELMAFYREDRKMLVDMTVKRVVNFHGHLCPELAIGIKACEYARRLLFNGGEVSGRISVYAENCTSALDALQVLLGVTLGNQCLKVLDFGKHNYTFSARNSDQGFTLRLKRFSFGDEQEYGTLEEKIAHQQISLDEVVRFQELLDGRVSKLLSTSPEDLFDVVVADQPLETIETPATYLSCASCGEQVLREHAVEHRGKHYCAPCIRLLRHPTVKQNLH
jgi:formylmethanofuran dehydrogenase subunit E